MNPNPLLDPLLCENVEAHQQDLLETACVTLISVSDWYCTRFGGALRFYRDAQMASALAARRAHGGT